MAAVTYQTLVDQVNVLSYNVRSFRLRLVEPNALAFEPGQFVITHVPTSFPQTVPAAVRERAAQLGSSVKRAYSIASPPHEAGVVELCVQHVDGGIASTYFWGLKPGMPVTLSGPHGRFGLVEPMTHAQIFLATGTGVAPFRGMIHHLCHLNSLQPIWLFFGCRYEHSILYEAEFRSIVSLRRNFHYIPVVSRPKEWHGESGHVQEVFRKQITDPSGKEMYVCGWDVVVKSVVDDLKTFGVPPGQIHYEEWA